MLALAGRTRAIPDPAVRFLLNQAAQARCALAQLIVVSAERQADEYVSWIGRQRVASLTPGCISIVDCFSDPCGWKASWAARQPENKGSQRSGEGSDATKGAAGDKVPIITATRDASNGYQDIVAAVRSLLAHPQHESQGGAGGTGDAMKKTLVLIDSVSYLLLRSGVQDVMRMIHTLCALPATCVAFVLHTDVHSADVCHALAAVSRCLVSVRGTMYARTHAQSFLPTRTLICNPHTPEPGKYHRD